MTLICNLVTESLQQWKYNAGICLWTGEVYG